MQVKTCTQMNIVSKYLGKTGMFLCMFFLLRYCSVFDTLCHRSSRVGSESFSEDLYGLERQRQSCRAQGAEEA